MSCRHNNWEEIYTVNSAGIPNFRICTFCNTTQKWKDGRFVDIMDKNTEQQTSNTPPLHDYRSMYYRAHHAIRDAQEASIQKRNDNAAIHAQLSTTYALLAIEDVLRDIHFGKGNP